MHDVLVCIVNWNQAGKTQKALEAVRRFPPDDVTVLLIDNGSTCFPETQFQQIIPGLVTVRLPHNIGAAGARNIGLRYFLRGDWQYVLFLDNDAIPEPDLITVFRETLRRNPSAGVVGAAVYYADRPGQIWSAGGRIDWCAGHFRETAPRGRKFRLREEQEVDTCPIGFTMCTRGAVERTGLLDEAYFIYYEESDWHWRMRLSGFRVVLQPAAVIHHDCSSSLGLESPAFYYYRTRNRLLFFFRHARYPERFLFATYFLVWDLPYNTLYTLVRNGMGSQFAATLLGLADFLRGAYGCRVIDGNTLSWMSPLISASRKVDTTITRVIRRTRRLVRHVRRRIHGAWPQILIEAAWRLGDEVMFLPAYDRLEKLYPSALFAVRSNYPELLAGREFLRRAGEGDAERCDRIIDLRGEDPRCPRREVLSQKIGGTITDYPKIPGVRQPVAGVVGICPGGGWECKRWAAGCFEQLIGCLHGAGVECRVYGLASERLRAGTDRTGRPLIETIAGLRECTLLVGNDSGLLHLALSLGIPAIGLFGPTSPEHLYGANPLLRSVISPSACRGCWNRGFMTRPGVCPFGTHPCMEQISLEAVVRAVREELSAACAAA